MTRSAARFVGFAGLLGSAGLIGTASARPSSVYWEEGRRTDVLYVELHAPAPRERARWAKDVDWHDLDALIGPARVRPVAASLPRFLRVDAPDAELLGTELLSDPRVADVWLGYSPMPPPADIDPITPDLRGDQDWLDAFPGLGFAEAARWPGGRGENVTIADIEYGWDEEHEDLEAALGADAWGENQHLYLYHGNSVLGQLVGGVNGYGIDGAAPSVEPLVISPFTEEGAYDIAAAIAGATELLRAGDVLLIEQQSYANGAYCPVSVDPAVFAAIEAAVAAGIVVVEPGGNGAQDLDHAAWEGWFDRSHDSGAILVGGGASPGSGFEARSWFPGGSSHGARLDVQAWYDGIVTATSGEYGTALADLYYPNEDARQAYTRTFGGTSGASPMIAAIAAIAQSIAIELTGEPWTPAELRAALIATGTPQAGAAIIGPQPDLRRLLRTYFQP
ncbi:MAG: S8 family serine peptidase [Pseudomonadota bacterium]|nr:S8 family serine peptidase [Pseudomonadota bacterium]